ncbi:DNA replication protein DnaC [Bradyrhizobium diazoefficiens]
MLTHPTLDLLQNLGLHGMAKGFKELDAQPEARSLEHAEWLALLLEQEKTQRQQKRFESRARAAKLRHAACVEDVDYRAIRGLDRTLFLKLAAGDWIRARHNLLVTGPCGVGKSWLACALGHKACRDDFAVAYHRVPRLFAALALGRADGRYTRMLRAIARLDLLILDDWGPEPLDADQRRDLLEIVEDRYEARSIIVTSQLPVDRWYDNGALLDYETATLHDVSVRMVDQGGLSFDKVFTLTITDVAGITQNGTSTANTLTGTNEGDTLHGLGGNDPLNGLGGNDVLDGGTGDDTMTGGAGNDLYIVDSSNDVVNEGANEGTDEIQTSLSSYTLGNNVENLTGTSSGGFTAAGNALDNVITGSSGNDVLFGDAILDRLVHNAYRIELKGESLRKQKQPAQDQPVS